MRTLQHDTEQEYASLKRAAEADSASTGPAGGSQLTGSFSQNAVFVFSSSYFDLHPVRKTVEPRDPLQIFKRKQLSFIFDEAMPVARWRCMIFLEIVLKML